MTSLPLRRLLVSIIWIAAASFASAQALTESDKAEIKADINRIYALFEQGDISALLDQTHPRLFELVGGRASFERLTESAIEQLMASGIVFLDSELGEPSPLHQAGGCQISFVPRVSTMELQNIRMKSVGFMIAVRDDGQADWKYLDGSGLRRNPQLLAMLFPELDPDIELPPNTVERL